MQASARARARRSATRRGAHLRGPIESTSVPPVAAGVVVVPLGFTGISETDATAEGVDFEVVVAVGLSGAFEGLFVTPVVGAGGVIEATGAEAAAPVSPPGV